MYTYLMKYRSKHKQGHQLVNKLTHHTIKSKNALLLNLSFLPCFSFSFAFLFVKIKQISSH